MTPAFTRKRIAASPRCFRKYTSRSSRKRFDRKSTQQWWCPLVVLATACCNCRSQSSRPSRTGLCHLRCRSGTLCAPRNSGLWKLWRGVPFLRDVDGEDTRVVGRADGFHDPGFFTRKNRSRCLINHVGRVRSAQQPLVGTIDRLHHFVETRGWRRNGEAIQA